ncbi:MAG: hypothetical protein ACRDKB_12705 [Actinomycetota bacterium]
MRPRLLILIWLAFALVASPLGLFSVAAHASATPVLAQEQSPGGAGDPVGEQEEAEQQEERDEEDTAEETGAGGEEGEAATETGPQWTYQMARIAMVGVVALGLAIGAAYYRFVVMRRRGGV